MATRIHQALLFGNLQTWLRQADCILDYTERSSNFTFPCESVLFGYDTFHCSLKMLIKKKEKKSHFVCLQRERTSNSKGIINWIKLRWIIIIQYQVVSKLLQSNKSGVRLCFVSRSRKKQTNKHKSMVFLAASYCNQCTTGPNGPKVGHWLRQYQKNLLYREIIIQLLNWIAPAENTVCLAS